MKLKIIPVFVLLSVIICLPAAGQKQAKKTVLSGYVTDNSGKPVRGAMILIDKKYTNIQTDDKGFYRLKIKPDAKLLTVFTTKTGNEVVGINGQTSINIRLSGSALNQAPANERSDIVDIGYASSESKNVTSQVNKIDATSGKYASFSNIYDMLRGVVPGVQVSGKTITIQGISSANGKCEPLFVLDGNVVSSIDDIMPVEVKSIEVLKGASATIYGSRGQNGVILIHLKGIPDRK
jgi:TonB-dependent SusC/RagA subfamily outer membrane receptor